MTPTVLSHNLGTWYFHLSRHTQKGKSTRVGHLLVIFRPVNVGPVASWAPAIASGVTTPCLPGYTPEEDWRLPEPCAVLCLEELKIEGRTGLWWR
jgi:hypothetical protein